MRFNALEDWLAWQETAHVKDIDLGLDRIRQVAAHLDLLNPAAKVITVAGTNGKGSCVAALEALLISQGVSVGAYSSPHLVRYNERIRLNGAPADDAAICRAFAGIDEARGEISLSYFEFGTLAAFWLFRESAVDYWLLEVGLGGRLDATNLLNADIAVVTSIALDHQQFLGDDRESIGREKAGIFRAGNPAVCADRQPPQSVVGQAQSLHCPFYQLGEDFNERLKEDHWQVILEGPGEKQVESCFTLPIPSLPPPSVAAALQVLALLEVLPDQEQMASVIAEIGLPGRFQSLDVDGQRVYLDVAHNPAAAEYLAGRLKKAGVKRVSAVVAIMADKDIGACLQPLLPYVRDWRLAALPDIPRAASPNQLCGVLAELGVADEAITCHSSVADALQQRPVGKPAAATDALLVTGSFFTVAEALQALNIQVLNTRRS